MVIKARVFFECPQLTNEEELKQDLESLSTKYGKFQSCTIKEATAKEAVIKEKPVKVKKEKVQKVSKSKEIKSEEEKEIIRKSTIGLDIE